MKNISLWILLVILYAVLGLCIATPYCILAGWDRNNFSTVVGISPAVSFLTLLLIWLTGTLEESGQWWKFTIHWKALFPKPEDDSFRKFSLTVFWLWTAVLIMPIAVHWFSKTLLYFGYETLGGYLFVHRYQSGLGFLLILMAVFVLRAFLLVVGNGVVFLFMFCKYELRKRFTKTT